MLSLPGLRDARSADPRPGAPPAGEPWRVVAAVVIVLAALAWAVVGYRELIVIPAYHAHDRLYGVPANGDHLYYTSMMLQFTGSDFAQSLRAAARHNHYGLPATHLAYGYLDPSVAPLIYPRTMLPLVAGAFRPVLGVRAIEVPGILAAALTPILLWRGARRIGAGGFVLAPVVLLLATCAFDEFGAGIYTEAMTGVLLAAAAAVLPWDGERMTRARLAFLAAVTLVAPLSRQLGPAFAGLACGGLVWAVVFGRDRRAAWRVWRLPAALATGVSLVGTLVVTRWAPYDAIYYVERDSGIHSRWGATLHAVVRTPWVYLRGIPGELAHDPLLVVLFAATFWAGVRVRRSPVVGGLLGAAVPVVLSVGLNGSAPWRYTEPVYPLFVLVVAAALASRRQARVVTDGDEEGARGAGAVGPPTRLATLVGPARWGAAGAAVLLAAGVVGGTVLAYRPAGLQPAGTLAAADLPGRWPLTVPSLRLSCGGDNGQVLGRTPTGHVVDVTGTALARFPLHPSVVTVTRRVDGLPVDLTALVEKAVARCAAPIPHYR